MDCSPPGSSVHGIPGKNAGVPCHPPGDCLTQGLNLSPASEPLGFWALISLAAAAAAKSLQSCPTLCDPIDNSPPGCAVPGILQARILEWVAIVFSNAWKWKVKVRSLSRVWLFATPWTVAYQAFPSMGFSRQEYWSGKSSPSPLALCNKHSCTPRVSVHQYCQENVE